MAQTNFNIGLLLILINSWNIFVKLMDKIQFNFIGTIKQIFLEAKTRGENFFYLPFLSGLMKTSSIK